MTRPAAIPLLVPRRAALLSALLAPLACRSGTRSAPAASSVAAPTSPGAPPLDVLQVTQMRADERGGVAVVLLHGYGAPGDDLLSLARSLLRTGTRCILPAAPLALGNGGRAWWHLEASDRPPYLTDIADGGAIRTPAPSAELEAARSAVQAVLHKTREQYAPEQLVLIGFSQGAMLALDVALAAAPPVQRVAVLSGAFLADAAVHTGALHALGPAVFISHGREDTRLPFSGAERMKIELEQRGLRVTWQPFSGGHEIPEAVVRELRTFLFG